MKPEILDVVDANDQVVGTIDRADYGTLLEQRGRYIRAAHVFIVNSEGQLWIPVRTATKRIAPNGYDYSAAGHVEAGESYLAGLLRETQEETGLTLTPADVELVAVLKSEAIRYICATYITRSDEAPDFNPDDFVGAEWLPPAELIRRIDAGHPAKDSLRETVQVVDWYLQGR